MSDDSNISFQTIDWTVIPKTEHSGEFGTAFWQTMQFSGLRMRIVETRMAGGHKKDIYNLSEFHEWSLRCSKKQI